ncbi:hypothetical protein MNBD_PLANCTO02-2154, partial [hydrothermal vent metagenome]
MAVVFLLFPSYAGAIIGGNGKAVTENMNQTVFKIEGMSCEGCAESATEAITEVLGVSSVNVDFKSGTATVKYPKGG